MSCVEIRWDVNCRGEGEIWEERVDDQVIY
jgi:hypothetical protein